MSPTLRRLLMMVGTATGTLIAVAVLAAAVLWYAAASSCANSSIAEYLAPGGRIKAVVFERDCGATTGFSTQVSLLSIGESLRNESGNLFVADHAGSIRVSWRPDTQLRVEHHAKARLFKTEPKYQNVSIEYVSVK